MTTGVNVLVGVTVDVRVDVTVRGVVGELVGGVPVTVGVPVFVGVLVFVGVGVSVGVGVIVGVSVMVGVGVKVRVLLGVAVGRVPVAVGVGLKQALCAKLTVTSSIHHPAPPPAWSVPSRKRKSTLLPLYAIRSTVACTHPPLLPLHASRPPSGFWLAHPSSVLWYPPLIKVGIDHAVTSVETSSTPPSSATCTFASRSYNW